jgi:hypothetical protein
MPNPLDRLKDLHRKVFVSGQEAVADEVAAQEHTDRQKLYQEGMKVAEETIDLANEMAKDGDPHKQQLAALIKANVIGAAQEATAGRHQAVEVRGAQGASPFLSSGPSTPSATSLPGTEPKALPHEPTKPPKRGPGRPRKSS